MNNKIMKEYTERDLDNNILKRMTFMRSGKVKTYEDTNTKIIFRYANKKVTYLSISYDWFYKPVLEAKISYVRNAARIELRINTSYDLKCPSLDGNELYTFSYENAHIYVMKILELAKKKTYMRIRYSDRRMKSKEFLFTPAIYIYDNIAGIRSSFMNLETKEQFPFQIYVDDLLCKEYLDEYMYTYKYDSYASGKLIEKIVSKKKQYLDTYYEYKYSGDEIISCKKNNTIEWHKEREIRHGKIIIDKYLNDVNKLICDHTYIVCNDEQEKFMKHVYGSKYIKDTFTEIDIRFFKRRFI